MPEDLTASDWEAFLRAGGVLTMDEWLALDPGSRNALAQAGESLWLSRAATRASLTVSGQDAIPAALRPIDGGDALRGQIGNEILDRAAASRRWMGATP